MAKLLTQKIKFTGDEAQLLPLDYAFQYNVNPGGVRIKYIKYMSEKKKLPEQSGDEEESQVEFIDLKNEDLLFSNMGIKLGGDEDRQEVKQILFDLGYPSSELAHLHYRCDRIGTHDVVKTEETKDLKKKTSTGKSEESVKMICPCCGFRVQEKHVPVCTSFEYIPRLGQSIDLFFMMIRHAINLMIIMTLAYSAFAIATNVVASQNTCYLSKLCMVSEGAKQTNAIDAVTNYYMIQSWLGLGMVIIWGFYFFYMSYKERKLELDSDMHTKSASDFSLMVEFLPSEFDEKKFQETLAENFKSIVSVPQTLRRAPQIAKFNVARPFYMNEKDLKDQELEKLQDQYKDELSTLRDWIKERIDDESTNFKTPKAQRDEHYKTIKEIKEKIVARSQILLKKIEQEYKQKFKNRETNTVFVTLTSSLARKMIEKLNSQQLSNRIRRFFASIRRDESVPISGVRVTRAPQPEDVLWMNVGVPECEIFWRKFLTFSATMIILGISFVAIYGLSVAQVKEADNIIISVVISIVITVINIVIGIVIKILTEKQKNFTMANYQRSLALKVIFAQLMNMVIVTFLANYFIKGRQSLYTAGGLIEDVFFVSATNAFLSPILRIIDIGFYVKKIMIKYFDRPVPRLKMSQDELNELLGGTEFEIGFEYVYIIKTCVFTSFFVSLQPVISIMAIIGLLLMYWAEKYVLFNRAKRPPPGSDIINAAMSQVIYLCPLVYSLGSLTWPIFIPGGSPYSSLLPNLIAVGASVVMFIIPLEAICNCCINEQERADAEIIYDKERIFFTTEYDRRNPATMKQGYDDYVKYLEDLKNKIDKSTEDSSVNNDVKNQFNDLLMKQAVQNQASGFSGGNLFFGGGAGGFGGGGFGQRQQAGYNPFTIMQMATAQPVMPPPQNYNPLSLMMPQQQMMPQPQMMPQQQMHPVPQPGPQPPMMGGSNQIFPQPQVQRQQQPVPVYPPGPQGFQPAFAPPQQPFGFSPLPQQFGFAPPQQRQFGFAPPQNGFGFAPQGQFGFAPPRMAGFNGFGFNM